MAFISFSDIGRQNICRRLLLRFTQSDFLEGDITFQYINLVLFDRQLLISEHGEGIFLIPFFQDTNIFKLSVTLCKKVTLVFVLNTQTTNTYPSKSNIYLISKVI